MDILEKLHKKIVESDWTIKFKECEEKDKQEENEANMRSEKIRFVILKESANQGVLRNTDQNGFEQLNIGFTWNEFVEEVNFLVRKGLLTKPFYADDTIYSYTSIPTTQGEEFYESSKWYKKAYGTAKEVRDWVNFIKDFM